MVHLLVQLNFLEKKLIHMLNLSTLTLLQTKLKRLLPTILLISFASQIAHAQIYKCEEASGKINFQDNPCTKGESKEFTLNKPNTMDKNKQLNRYKINPNNSKENTQKKTAAHPTVSLNKMMCDTARTAYETQVSQIKARCKKGRETFCSKSAEDIQKEWDRHYLKNQRGDVFSRPTQQWYAFHQNGGAPIFGLKAKMKQYCKN